MTDDREDLNFVQKVMDGDLQPFIHAYLRQYGAVHSDGQ